MNKKILNERNIGRRKENETKSAINEIKTVKWPCSLQKVELFDQK